MNRCLHVTINEGSGAKPRRARVSRPGRLGSDPASEYLMPPIDDPASEYLMPPIDDPASEYLMPPIDDPASEYLMPPIDDPSGTGGHGGSSGSGGCGEATATVSSCCCGCHCGCGASGTSSSPKTTTPHPFIAPRDFSGFVIVRMAPGIDDSNSKNLWELATRQKRPLPGLKAVLELPLKSDETKPAQRPASEGNQRPVTDPASGQDPAKAQASTTAQPPQGILVSRPLVELLQRRPQGPTWIWAPMERDAYREQIRNLEKRTALTAFPPLHSLTDYWRIDLRGYPNLVEDVVASLNRLSEVDLAYRELAASDPKVEPDGQGFAEDQGYLNDAPLGIAATWAWESLTEQTFRTIKTTGEISKRPDISKRQGSSGTLPGTQPVIPTLKICDLEQGWNPKHNDLATAWSPGVTYLYGDNRADDEPASFGNHGTAVLGELAATGQNPQSVKGAVTTIGQFLLASHYRTRKDPDPDIAGTNGHLAAAIVQAVNDLDQTSPDLGKGDILLIEAQRGLLPIEVDEADLDAIRLASGLGIIVIEAAGNGGFNLDAWSDPDTGRTLRRGDPRFRDSGAVLVGAARANLPHDRAPFSNYGSRLDCYGWGETVTTLGYGDLSGQTPDDLYTNSFSGTSSASPIVAGAAALLQALHFNYAKTLLEPRTMRSLLSDPTTGTPQGPNVAGRIGVMPNLKAIVHERLQLVPVVYMRRSVCDNGSRPGQDDEISSSPDILFWPGTIGDRYNEGKGRENLPAPGVTFMPGSSAPPVYLRLRNRGLRAGDAHIHLFASPTATLITPDRWIPWGSLDATNLPQGDTLTVAGPVPSQYTLTNLPSAPKTPWSFLAVLFRIGEHDHTASFFDWMTGLPSRPPYFDWQQYRVFLRRQGVTWRNTHRVTAADASLGLPFFIAGTPDRTRLFDFEIIQRLPEGSTVTLQVPAALGAKFRQRQPWIGGTSGQLSLPNRPRTSIKGVALAAQAYVDVSFKVQAPAGALNSSHSLAIRQLWHGEEVGRITWYFGLDT